MRNLRDVDPTTAAILGGFVGLGIGGVAILAVRATDRSRRNEAVIAAPSDLPPGVGEVLSVLRSSGIVVDRSDQVVNNSPAAVAYGLVRGQEVVHPELLHLARAVRRDGVIREAELDLRKGIGQGTVVMAARVAPLGADHVLLLVEDISQARRVEEIRRDFLANVSHELKTPVGGISLLAEALLDAYDDPEAVQRFASRIGVESRRLSSLVKDIVELSRLQGADVVKESTVVDVGAASEDAVERYRLLAEEHGIEIAVQADRDCLIWGDRDLVTTAVGNLIGNAIAYSDAGTRVGVSTRRRPGRVVEVAVTDQGLGIAPEEQQRIFERFYRVDSARSRATGGTGLGLAIVKHVVENHGGTVSVWSQVDRGSTFTISLPAAPSDAAFTVSPQDAEADSAPHPDTDTVAEPRAAAADAGGAKPPDQYAPVEVHPAGPARSTRGQS